MFSSQKREKEICVLELSAMLLGQQRKWKNVGTDKRAKGNGGNCYVIPIPCFPGNKDVRKWVPNPQQQWEIVFFFFTLWFVSTIRPKGHYLPSYIAFLALPLLTDCHSALLLLMIEDIAVNCMLFSGKKAGTPLMSSLFWGIHLVLLLLSISKRSWNDV